MTALLTLEREPLARRLTVVRYAAGPGESTAGLQPGERLTVADLLRALLLASANEAAETLAVRVGGSQPRFIALMNRRARGSWGSRTPTTRRRSGSTAPATARAPATSSSSRSSCAATGSSGT